MPRALIAGFGFTGQPTARLLQAAGWEVTGITHTEESATRLTTKEIPVIACDISDAAMVKSKLSAFEKIDALVDCVSSGRGGADAYRKNYLQGAQTLLEILHPQKFLFTSSTSVYAQTDGSWVTEESPAEPARDTSQILRETEQLVLAHSGIHGIVCRLAGIYGPGRWVLLKKFLEGTAVIEAGGARWINSIHRDDAAAAIAFLLNNRTPSGIYNVSDSTPLTQLDCYEFLANHFQKPIPPSGEPDPNRKRGITSKRVSNAKLCALGWSPQFPSIRDAVAAGTG